MLKLLIPQPQTKPISYFNSPIIYIVKCLLQAIAGQGVFIPVNSSFQIAITFYYANRETMDGKGRKAMNYGYSIRRVAKMHEIAYSLLQERCGETKRHDPGNHERGKL